LQRRGTDNTLPCLFAAFPGAAKESRLVVRGAGLVGSTMGCGPGCRGEYPRRMGVGNRDARLLAHPFRYDTNRISASSSSAAARASERRGGVRSVDRSGSARHWRRGTGSGPWGCGTRACRRRSWWQILGRRTAGRSGSLARLRLRPSRPGWLRIA